jgi:hypothetical protein
MKILGLTPGKLLVAILLAGCITIAVTFAMAPHPVSVPQQIITPVPTPPPVVITEQPTPAPASPEHSEMSPELRRSVLEIQSTVAMAFDLLRAFMIFMLFVVPISYGLRYASSLEDHGS